MRITAASPTWPNSRTAATLLERAKASSSVIVSEYCPLAFFGRYEPVSNARLSIRSSGPHPSSSAASQTNSLKVEPGWRRAWVTRLNGDLA